VRRMGMTGWSMRTGMKAGVTALTLLLGTALTAALPAGAQTLDLSKPEDAFKVMRKVQCSTKDGQPGFYWWEGNGYSHVAGERDKLLFKVQGMNVRACYSKTDEKRGPGAQMVTREIMIYLDPQTGEVLRTWKNPWTNESVEVLHVANDPVNNFMPAAARGGGPYVFPGKIVGPVMKMAFEVPLFYPNPLADSYQKDTPNYHAVELFNFFANKDDLLDAKKDWSPTASVAWTRIAPWLPWMGMGDRKGEIYFNAVGLRLASFDDMPDVLKAEIRKNYPIYTAPPPADDTRPNETSWTYYEKVMDQKAGITREMTPKKE
jgi:hypothetical protein